MLALENYFTALGLDIKSNIHWGYRDSKLYIKSHLNLAFSVEKIPGLFQNLWVAT